MGFISKHRLAIFGPLFFGFILLSHFFVIAQRQINKADSQSEYGVSFSIKYAEELGLNWKDTFLALTDDLGFKKMRLMSYWDLYEKENNQFDFTSLDWQLQQAEQKGIEVDLAIGGRQPRWPECHVPQWANELNSESFDKELVEYVETVARRYKDNSSITAWQLENEAANRVFADCEPKYDSERLKSEFKAVKAIDSTRPVVINASNTSGIPALGQIGDEVGFSIYKRFYTEIGGVGWQGNYFFVPNTWHAFRAGLVDLWHGKSSFVHEIQAEPWGKKSVQNLTESEASETMDPKKLKDIIGYAKQAGFDEMYLWGGEWWYWQKTVLNNPAMWQAVSDIIK